MTPFLDHLMSKSFAVAELTGSGGLQQTFPSGELRC